MGVPVGFFLFWALYFGWSLLLTTAQMLAIMKKRGLLLWVFVLRGGGKTSEGEALCTIGYHGMFV